MLGLVIRALIFDTGHIPKLIGDLTPIRQHLREQSVEDLPTGIELMLINADIEILPVEYPAQIIKACKEATVIIVNSNDVHYIACCQTWTPKDPRVSTPEAWANYLTNGAVDK